MKKEKIVTLTLGRDVQLYWIKTSSGYRPLNERELARRIPFYSELNDKARERHLNLYLANAKIIVQAKVPAILPNTRKTLKSIPRRYPNLPDYQAGTTAFLQLIDLFQKPEVGLALICDILCGLRCAALRESEPGFRPVLSIPSHDAKVIEVFKTVVTTVVTRNKWYGKNCTIKRASILDFRFTDPLVGRHLQDFNRVQVKVKKREGITTPISYQDTLVLIIGANNAQMNEVSPYLENASSILLNSSPRDLGPEKFSADAVASYDPNILERLGKHRAEIAAVLRTWWAAEEEDVWAQNVVSEARGTFGKMDSKYIAVYLNPQKLRRAIQYQVLQSFFAEVELLGWINANALSEYRQTAKAVFDPDPIVETPPKCMEDPNVFLELMGQFSQEQHDRILQEPEPFVKVKKPLAAYRTISNERHLIMLESTFKTVYSKAARNAKGIDTSFLQKDKWERELQKIMSQSGVIKEATSGYRYRYGLYGSKEAKVYVLAIPCHLLA